MIVHKNARLTAHSRADLVRRVLSRGQSAKAVATAFGVGATAGAARLEANCVSHFSHQAQADRLA